MIFKNEQNFEHNLEKNRLTLVELYATFTCSEANPNELS